MEDELLPLQILQPGERAIVAELLGPPHEVLRLQEMGLRAGESVEVIQSGSPCIIRLGGHKLCFRDSDGFNVLVRSRTNA